MFKEWYEKNKDKLPEWLNFKQDDTIETKFKEDKDRKE